MCIHFIDEDRDVIKVRWLNQGLHGGLCTQRMYSHLSSVPPCNLCDTWKNVKSLARTPSATWDSLDFHEVDIIVVSILWLKKWNSERKSNLTRISEPINWGAWLVFSNCVQNLLAFARTSEFPQPLLGLPVSTVGKMICSALCVRTSSDIQTS